MNLLELMKAIILGLVEGLTEFAPVSSTGHMIIVDDMWLKTEELLGSKYVANTFKVVIQLGSILAVLVVFRNRFIDLLGLSRWMPKAKGEAARQSGPRLKLMQVIVGLIPAGILGVLFEDFIDEHLFSTATVLIGLVIGALLMIAADRFAPKRASVDTVDQITYKQALGIGLFQCLSIWPGFSRSGSTISGGVLLGLSHRAAADFTFIMAVPIMAGASLISLMKNLEYFTIDALPFFIVGFISAFVFALLAIRFFLKLIDRIKLVPFAVYRILLALVIWVVYF
ncbi:MULTISPECIES: undecaprenyl-diphosphate phosphatase [Paenibacillus]|uniref:Undecaprenyl-diphosphatase n=1 Tax=Paenibacillus barengoltzii J12 TaxID=935846 RepID=A0ABY1M1R3_9BACL|nr:MULTISPECIES: undecaprenyl-diphosphate phosphatase [Paenibacillus]MDU0332624.1 undecaprenyl-diphosphate phosphatase [Paenibacillus sp. 3LSP]MEC2343878.1 undecaprenyl-diphosphate phosphatase [Paenibacillus barengoltzii]SME96665.1 undecaprenyl-diphosphatase [Paenibacillus barengoltzii]SMF42399.1 undecaprenyl-diphosphatase [Paenibacillus barengoltzii J12]